MMNSPKLILVRHGVTVNNKAGRLMGRNDSPLTEETKRDAQTLGKHPDISEYLKGAKTIWASPLPRALETARLIVGDREVTVETANALIERDFGVYNGRLLAELWGSDPEWKEAEGEYRARPRDGESLFDVEMRIFPFLVDLHKNVDKSQHLILVGHSTVWRLVAAALNGRRKFPLEEKIAGPLSVQEYPRQDIQLLSSIVKELNMTEKEN